MPVKNYPCPSCGAEIPFRTSIAAYAICPYCRTMVVRQDDGIKNIGTMAQLPEDMSPFQIGADGYYKGVHFGIVGRMRIGWDDGSWNEWFMVSDDMKRGWLAEAQGFYAPCFDTTAEIDSHRMDAIRDLGAMVEGVKDAGASNPMGKSVSLTLATYRITDIKQAECLGSEGELPFKAPQGRKTWSVDLTHGEGQFASIEFGPEGARVFEGQYVEWPDLRCGNYRHFEGW
jgi:DNA-directed RNA polymerase subunit RPC12/RpoP